VSAIANEPGADTDGGSSAPPGRIVNVAGTRTFVSALVGLVRVAVPVEAERGRGVGAGVGAVEVDGPVALDEEAVAVVLDVSLTLDSGAAVDVRVGLELVVEPPQAANSTTVGIRANTVSRRLIRPG
jgi:hypothetical protein